VAKVDDIFGRKDTYLDLVVRRLLNNLSVDENDPIWRFFNEIASDQGAIIQLTPEGMHLYNAAVSDRPSTKYSCVITAAPAPSLASFTSLLVRSPRAAGSHLLFAVLYALASHQHSHYPYPSPAEREASAIQKKIPFKLGPGTNDGIAPTLSQIYGQVLGVEIADHLDVIGQFADAGEEPYTDWMESGANFNERDFIRVWDRIANLIAGSAPSKKRRTELTSKGKALV
jgi:hypothetical protein